MFPSRPSAALLPDVKSNVNVFLMYMQIHHIEIHVCRLLSYLQVEDNTGFGVMKEYAVRKNIKLVYRMNNNIYINFAAFHL